MEKTPGSIYLIGAGPGDLEYLTLKAVRILGEVDVVLLDSLVNRDILQFVAKDATVIDVGKRCGRASTPQALISNLLIDYARQGLKVARVKGGDPFIFGRGGEEMSAIREAGLEATVVSGISSGIAIPNSLGIPLTHRDLAHSFTFITGGRRENGKAYDWQAIVASESTLVVFMGLSSLDKIADSLIMAGKDPGTPSVAVENGTLKEQRTLFSPLKMLSELAEQAEFASPTLAIIGAVVSLSPGWSDKLLTGSPGDSAGFNLINPLEKAKATTKRSI